MLTQQFDYHLPRELIAQRPASPRDQSRLLVFNRRTRSTHHDRFRSLSQYLRPGDVLVFNDTKVFPARLHGTKATGGTVEVFLLRSVRGRMWEVLIGGSVRQPGSSITFKHGLRCTVSQGAPAVVRRVVFNRTPAQVLAYAERYGATPTPPYIKEPATRSAYQTVYAQKSGSVAAPTAGFHFTKRLLAELRRGGVQCEYVTLHVGLGTFQPVTERDIRQHRMHAEYAQVPAAVAARLRQAKRDGRRVIAVGTTSVRVLETVGLRRGGYRGWINQFIYPGYRFKIVDGMVTNFHLPESTLLMLVAAFIGRKEILRLYNAAVRRRYRFYSFGDGMMIE
ncbi:MAG: tRNA preQ1(34) S-adenosylmethionine ribosyltransferase-isomerase QueA [Patescibacteria group bacterium]